MLLQRIELPRMHICVEVAIMVESAAYHRIVETTGQHLEAGGAANGSPWGDKCKPVGRQMEAGGAAHGGSHE